MRYITDLGYHVTVDDKSLVTDTNTGLAVGEMVGAIVIRYYSGKYDSLECMDDGEIWEEESTDD